MSHILNITSDSAQFKDFSAISPPLALNPLDGRYRGAAAPLVNDLSEAALNRNRILVEVEWFIYLMNNRALPGTEPLTAAQQEALRAIGTNFGPENIQELAELERDTVHDVKAVEYYIKDRLGSLGLRRFSELVHFGCTSEDVNNLSYALGIKNATINTWLPAADLLRENIAGMARAEKGTPMLSRTHGQPATPTTLGKELAVTAHRLARQLRRIEKTEYLGKLNGATGTYAAHYIAAPETDWLRLSRDFVASLGLRWNPLTTQIEPHDWQTELYADIARFNRILHNFSTDVWAYVSLGYFQQVPVAGATGSSTMPHKINPIRFENAEANLEVSNALYDVLIRTLSTSRLQRDLTDSAMQRNIGSAFGYSLLAISNLSAGLQRLDTAPEALAGDLDANWEVLAEAIQMVMRAENIQGIPGLGNPYERLKKLTQGRRLCPERIRGFIKGLGLTEAAESRLLALTPGSYVGVASELVQYMAEK